MYPADINTISSSSKCHSNTYTQSIRQRKNNQEDNSSITQPYHKLELQNSSSTLKNL